MKCWVIYDGLLEKLYGLRYTCVAQPDGRFHQILNRSNTIARRISFFFFLLGRIEICDRILSDGIFFAEQNNECNIEVQKISNIYLRKIHK